MGMDLRGAGGDLHCGVDFWRHTLCLAQMYGWQPAGTESPQIYHQDSTPDDPAWAGSYFSNDYQEVTDDDARALAVALQEALDDIPDAAYLDGILSANLFEYFAGEKPYLREFIAYCQKGGFLIG